MNASGFRLLQNRLVKRKGTPESALLAEVMRHLLVMPGVEAIRMSTGVARFGGRYVPFGFPGMADIYVRVRVGRGNWSTLWIETKGTKDQSESQIAFEEMVTRWGDRYVVARSLQHVLAAIQSLT